MARLRGSGLGVGMALGTAAVVTVRGGVPLLPEMPERIANLIATRRLSETPEVVLVARDYAMAYALASSLTWAKVVGIAAERAEPDAPFPPFPAVVSVPGLLAAATQDVLMLIDARNGVVLVDPDPISLSQYTAEHDHLAPKHRYYLDEAHLPAQTLDGRTLQIVASTEEESGGVGSAIEAGADRLYAALPLDFDSEAQRKNLMRLVNAAASKPLILAYNSVLSLPALLETAAYTDLTMAIPPSPENEDRGADAEGVARLVAEMAVAQAECQEQDIPCGLPRLTAEFVYRIAGIWPEEAEDAALVEALAQSGVTELLFSGPLADPGALAHLERLTMLASGHLIPVICYLSPLVLPTLETEFLTGIETLIGAGVAGFLTAPSLVVDLKRCIRELNYSECRENLMERLSGTGEGM